MKRMEVALAAFGVVVVVGGGIAVSAVQRTAPVAGFMTAACRSAVAGDADGDAWADPVVRVAGPQGGLQLFDGTADGPVAGPRLRAGAGLPVDAGSGIDGVTEGDVTGDGCADAVVLTAHDLVVLTGGRTHGLSTYPARSIRIAALHLPRPRLVPAGGRAEIAFGSPTTGDFDGDGFGDLAMVETTRIGSVREADVVVVPGSAAGLEPARARRVGAARTPSLSSAAGGGFAGGSVRLVSGAVRGGTTDDLGVVVGPQAGVSTKAAVRHGDVRTHPVADVVYGAPGGLGTGRATQVWDRESAGVPGSDAAGAGSVDATFGDFDGDGDADLAVSSTSSHAVTVLRGTSSGLTATASSVFAPGRGGLPDGRGSAGFGTAIASGDFDGDGHDELAVEGAAGRMWVLQGSASGPLSRGALRLTLPDGLGRDPGAVTMTAGSFGRGESSDLLVALPGEHRGAGAVALLFGTPGRPGGITTTGAVVLAEGAHGVPGTARPGDHFGG